MGDCLRRAQQAAAPRHLDIVRAAARGRKKRFAPVPELWHHPYERLCYEGNDVSMGVRSERVDKKVTFPAGDLTLEGRVWLATGNRDVGVVLCHPHPLHGGNMYSNVVVG